MVEIGTGGPASLKAGPPFRPSTTGTDGATLLLKAALSAKGQVSVGKKGKGDQ